MLRLIEADLASTGQLHPGNGSPSCFLNGRTVNVLFRQGRHFGLQVVAHEIEFVDNTTLVGRMECGFCRRQSEDQPAMACINRLKSEDVAKEGAVSLSVFCIDDYVSARDHLDHILSKRLAEMNAAVDYFETQCVMAAYRPFVVDPGVGGHLPTALLSPPSLSGAHQRTADSLLPGCFVDE